MISHRWSDADADALIAAAGEDPADRALAARVYSSRIIGRDPDLVMHGGGNTSVKVTRPDLFGAMQDVLHVKGSGWDLDTIAAPGLPGVRLETLAALRALDALGDEDMVNVQRSALLDSGAPNPSVETLLHGWLPGRFVDHTHATPFLVLANLPDAADVAREVFGARLGIVPYIMPGFALARAAMEVFEADPGVEGLLLLKHGHFTWGESARESYDRVVAHSNAVAAHLGMVRPTALRRRAAPAERGAIPALRGALGDAVARAAGDRDAAMPLLDLRNGPEVMAFLERGDLAALAGRGVASPDHVIRVKPHPLVLRAADLAGGHAAIAARIEAFGKDYTAYFERQQARAGTAKTMLPPVPGLIWAEGLGLFGVGATPKAASVAGDLGEQNMAVMAAGEAAGGFRPIGEDDLFDMEYWSLEQAKLGKGKPPPMTGRVVLVTGAAGAIGLATARAFAAEGAALVLVDRDAEALARAAEAVGGGCATLTLDVTAPEAGAAAMQAATEAFGGLDILVSNAGAATSGAMTDLPEADLRAAFELNFFAHQRLAVAAAKLFAAQGRGGQILFNISKQAVNPGRDFGAYGLPKATTLALMRQLALELGGQGVRVNGVNADRIRSGLLDDTFIAERAAARGVTPEAYMAGNLIGREVEARHVAAAFVALARAERTSAHVMTVDGGNIEAALR